jgi:hypothetical protein
MDKAARAALLTAKALYKHVPHVVGGNAPMKSGGRVGRDLGGGAPSIIQPPKPQIIKPPVPDLTGYKDAPTKKIEDMPWRPLADVHADLGHISEIPSHVQHFGRFMDETSERAARTGLTPRDLLKAYSITRASIGRGALPRTTLEKYGWELPGGVDSLRPEGAMGEWLHTSAGQAYLHHALKGSTDHPEYRAAIQDAVRKFTPFGKQNDTEGKALHWGAQNLPGMEGHVSKMIAMARKVGADPREWREFIKKIPGVDTAKAGFLGSMMGMGNQPTLDARQIVLNTGLPVDATTNQRRRVGAGAEAVDRLAARQSAMDLKGLPEELQPYYQHLTHHTIWDKTANEQTTHQDLINAMRHAATGGLIEASPLVDHPVARGMRMAGLPGLREGARDGFKKGGKAQAKAHIDPEYSAWDQVPTLNPDHLVGHSVFPIFADLTRAGGHYHGIDSSRLDDPEKMMGGPGYPLLPESLLHQLAWAVQGKGRGTMKLNKAAKYILVSAMEHDTHRSNTSFGNALTKTMQAYGRDKRLSPEQFAALDEMVRRPSAQKELSQLPNFPGFSHPDSPKFIDKLSFEARKRIADILGSAEGQAHGAPNLEKVTRETLDPHFAGIPSRHGMFLMELAPGKAEDNLVDLKESGLPVHPSYKYGVKGRVVGKFHSSVAPEIMFPDFFKKANAAAKEKIARGETPNVRRAFDMSAPVQKITQDIADKLPRRPQDIQSAKAAQLALNAANDHWETSDTPVGKGGVGPAEFAQAAAASDASAAHPQYTKEGLAKTLKAKKMKLHRMRDGKVYFALEHGKDYKKEHGFEHPELGPNETAFHSYIDNQPGAHGIGRSSAVLKAVQSGATVADDYAVPTEEYPHGQAPDFLRTHGFEELGRVPFDEKKIRDPKHGGSEARYQDLLHHWRESGWDESRGMPSRVIMKWRGNDADRPNAVQNYLRTGSEAAGPSTDRPDVRSTSGSLQSGAQASSGPGGLGGQGDGQGDRGSLQADRPPRPADRLSRTLGSVFGMNPSEATHYGVDPADIASARQRIQAPVAPAPGAVSAVPKTPVTPAPQDDIVKKALRLTAPGAV